MKHKNKMKQVERTERGWPGHFCCAHLCVFHRNTLLECEEDAIRVVVSTVGDYRPQKARVAEEISLDRYYETMAFEAEFTSAIETGESFWDADVSRQIYFDSPWSISIPEAYMQADAMHEAVVEEISSALARGEALRPTMRIEPQLEDSQQ